MTLAHDPELLIRAQLLALARREVDITPRLALLSMVPGTELQRAEAQLAAIRSQRELLNTLLRKDPHAIATEQAQLPEGEREGLRAIKTRNEEALAIPRDRLSSDIARSAVTADLAALQAITNDVFRFAAMATMGSTADEQRAYHDALEETAQDIFKAVTLAHAAVTQAWEVMQAERTAAIQHAEHAVGDYIGAEQSAEYAYSDTFNPNGFPDSHFHEQARLARIDMMKALAALPDEVAEAVLERKQAVDHDRSTYSVAQIGEVRAYRAALTGRAEPSVTEAEHQRANEELRYQSVSTVASDLRDAIKWGDEQGFHDAFEAIKANAVIDTAALVEIAKAVTRTEVEATSKAALGAIEQHFYDAQKNLQQTHAQGMGR